MGKYKFSHIERFVIWKTYNYRCFHCGLPLKWKELTIDHLLPECLLYRSGSFSAIKKEYCLKNDFCINDFGNWVPAHDNCNNTKADYVPHHSPYFAEMIEKANHFSHVARNVYRKLIKHCSKDKVLAQILSKLKDGSITTSDLYQLIEKTTILYFGFPAVEPEDILHLPDKWKIMRVNKKQKYLTVTDGKETGIVPLAFLPHCSWRCPSCRHYGPWEKNRCLRCGNICKDAKILNKREQSI